MKMFTHMFELIWGCTTKLAWYTVLCKHMCIPHVVNYTCICVWTHGWHACTGCGAHVQCISNTLQPVAWDPNSPEPLCWCIHSNQGWNINLTSTLHSCICHTCRPCLNSLRGRSCSQGSGKKDARSPDLSSVTAGTLAQVHDHGPVIQKAGVGYQWAVLHL